MVVILQPDHAAALDLAVDSPEEPGNYLMAVISVAGIDELVALLVLISLVTDWAGSGLAEVVACSQPGGS